MVALALLVPVGLAAGWIWGQAASPAVAQTSEVTDRYNPAQTITVVGQGSVSTEPDIARVSIGAETSAETVAEAVAENETKMASIFAALEGVGIPEKDIQTTHYSISFERYPEPLPRTVGAQEGQPAPQYRVSNMVNVTIRNLDNVGEVLDAVIEAGANNIWGVSFGLEDEAAAHAGARSKAVEDALARAEALAELNGVELGPVMSVSKVISGGAIPMPVVTLERAAAGAGPISPGEVEVNYQVQVSYFIEP